MGDSIEYGHAQPTAVLQTGHQEFALHAPCSQILWG